MINVLKYWCDQYFNTLIELAEKKHERRMIKSERKKKNDKR